MRRSVVLAGCLVVVPGAASLDIHGGGGHAPCYSPASSAMGGPSSGTT